ncbi:hypothetical protein SAMN03080598_00338 [Algoriphagus boritolerans DSM 17298 = JCM 18970]|uniref:Uncharacterized protein n=1 Tax=Algoriphagus boritolerans DSM 17298 = JCM 18970 TaxID=1120964 RepID=A0A1H5SAF2_9BACT|nr:hypothetical protein SAMN03080598_00338 [Algoriphagus boritolerans DSM 17298 = JCM 18970]
MSRQGSSTSHYRRKVSFAAILDDFSWCWSLRGQVFGEKGKHFRLNSLGDSVEVIALITFVDVVDLIGVQDLVQGFGGIADAPVL